MIRTKGEKVFGVINSVILLLVIAAVLFPLLYILAASFSSGEAVVQGKVGLWPVDFSVDAYKKVFADSSIWIGYANTIFYTIFGTLISMALSLCGAYPLSRKRLGARRFFSVFISITMWFSAGMVPIYLNIKGLGMLDSRAGILLPFAINTFNVLLLKTAFESVPDSLEDAAAIDGANDIESLIRIYIPLVVPTMLTVWLFYAVERWNGYLWSMILLKDTNKQPLQVVLTSLITQIGASQQESITDMYDATTNFSKQTVIYATIVISVLPMLVVYPFIQKYFVKSVMVGAVKG
ncbi:MAG: carbohydrate ABC transporter permease [Firmicutes bacterium]|nr:carbohydrate ABC transporter permease [Bacillota bacterium]